MAEYNIYGVFEAEDIIKYGYMMIKRPPTSTKVRIKAWQSKYFVLRNKTQNLSQRLEYYKDENAFELQKPVEYSFYLDSIVYIGETHSSKSHCYPIMIVCSKQGAITLACDTEKVTKDWLEAINKVVVKVGGTSSSEMWAHVPNDDSPASTPELQRRATSDLSSVRSKSWHNLGPDASQGKAKTAIPPGYFVTTRLTPHSENNNIRGDYILCITEEEVSLKSAVDMIQTVVTWSVGQIRGFKSEPAASTGVKDMQLLTLKVGRRSVTGEGIFQFFTKHGDTIAAEIRRHSCKQVFQSAAEKRDAFHRRSTSGSASKSPPSAHPSRKLPRTMTAPAQRIASTLQENARRRAVTNPLPYQRTIEEDLPEKQNGRAVATDSEIDGSVSSNDSRPRSATESSVEKASDDDVFLTRQPYSEIDGIDDIKEESESNPYIDLLVDESAEPIHISDPVHARKASSDSLASSCSIGSEEGSVRSNSSLPRNFPGAQLIPEENEMDSEGYIRSEALHMGPAGNSLDGNGNVLNYLKSEKGTENHQRQISGNQSLTSCPVDKTTVKNGSLKISHVGGSVNRKMRESLIAQIKEPDCRNFPPKPKLERERALKSENVFPPKSNTEEVSVSADSRNEVASRHSLLDKLRAGDPEASKTMFEKIIAQMEKPQQNDVNELFPAVRHKRNSIGTLSTETVGEVLQKATTLAGGKGSHFTNRKHTVIEKSKSTCEGLVGRSNSPVPPPLPVRPADPGDLTRRRSSSSCISELSEENQRRPELAAAHRSTFFAKGMRSIDPHTLLLPLKTNINTSQLTGEAAIQARLLEKTEIRDEQAQSSTNHRRNSAVDDVGSCWITDERSNDDLIFCKSSENAEEDGQCEFGKRKDSKASKFVKKVWKLAPKPRRGSNESREVTEVEFAEKPRRDSLSPGDAMDIQGRFSGSEPSTPETSPQMSRKTSKSSPKSPRKTSREEKWKKDKESPEVGLKFSSASKMLRKVAKKDDAAVKKVCKEESPRKDSMFADNTAKHSAFSNKEKQNKSVPHEKALKDTREEKSKSNHESDDMIIGSCQLEDQLAPLPNMTDSQCALNSEDNVPAPALPPRKKFDPPPLPPRQAKSPTSFSSSPLPVHSSGAHHSGRAHQPAAPTMREGRRHSGQRAVGSVLKEEFLPPPPVPPRRENNQSPVPKKATANEPSSARAPVIQLTCSSPENQQDLAEKQNSDSEEDMRNATTDESLEQTPPILSDTHQSPDSLSHPVPRRPPKGERQSQAKEFFRSHASKRVSSPYSDAEIDENYIQYGNIDNLTRGLSSDHEGTSSEKQSSHVADSSNLEGNYISKTCADALSVEASLVIKSQREATRLKINLMKESSFDEELPTESDDASSSIMSVTDEDLECQRSAPKRPSTPLSIQRGQFTLSSVSIT